MTPPRRFVSWAAVSSLPQAKKVSLEDQLKTNRMHIERWNGKLVAELVVPGESRSIVLFEDACARIEAYAALRTLIEERAFDVLIFLDRSRLGRVASLSMAVVELCHRAGIVTYATDSPPSSLDHIATTYVDNLIGAVQSVTAQEEVSKLMRRHNMGMTARVMRGDFPNVVPYGWQARYEIDDDGKPVQIVEVDEEAREVIVAFFDLYAFHGMSLGAIGREFRDRGYQPPKGGNWERGSLTTMLDLVWRYAGYVELNRVSEQREYVRARSRWPAIIDEAVVKSVMDERLRRANERRSVGSTHRFSGCVWCAYCQNKMKGHRGSVPNRAKTKYYPMEKFVCRNADGNVTHPKSTISSRLITDAVRDAIIYLQDEANRDAILGQYESHFDKLQTAIDRLTNQLAKNDMAAGRAYDAFVDGHVSAKQYKVKAAQLREQRKRIEAELALRGEELLEEHHNSQRGQRLLEVAAEGLAMLDCPDLGTANAWFRRHLKITINNFATEDESRIVVDYL